MPTKQELTDLTSKCEWETNTVNGVKGYVVSGKGDYATVSIFLPFAGKALGDALQQPGVEGHGIDVATNAIPGLQLRYATTIDGEFSEEAPLYTNVCEETVWVELNLFLILYVLFEHMILFFLYLIFSLHIFFH